MGYKRAKKRNNNYAMGFEPMSLKDRPSVIVIIIIYKEMRGTKKWPLGHLIKLFQTP